MSKILTPWTVAAIGTEDAEQQALIMWANMAMFAGFDAANNEQSWLEPPPLVKNPVTELTLLFAIPNGGLRNPATANRLRATGVKRGVPDLFLPVARSDGLIYPEGKLIYHGLFIELKRSNCGVVSNYQKQWQKQLTEQGYWSIICYGWIEAKDALQSYLEGNF